MSKVTQLTCNRARSESQSGNLPSECIDDQNCHGHSKGRDCFLQVGGLSLNLSPFNALPLSLGKLLNLLNLDFPNWEMKTLVVLISEGLEPTE